MNANILKFANIFFRTAQSVLPDMLDEKYEVETPNINEDYYSSLLETDDYHEGEMAALDDIVNDPSSSAEDFKTAAMTLANVNPEDGPINVEWILNKMKDNQNLTDEDKREIIGYIRDQKENVLKGVA